MYVGQNHNDLLTKIEKLYDPFLDGKRTILEETRKHNSKKVVSPSIIQKIK
jgi:hypothetical protein